MFLQWQLSSGLYYLSGETFNSTVFCEGTYYNKQEGGVSLLTPGKDPIRCIQRPNQAYLLD